MPAAPDKRGTGLEDEAAFEASLGAGVHTTDQAQDVVAPPAPPGAAVRRAAARQPSWAGRTLGHFRLLRLIGEGTMGIVIQALDIHLQRVVALKVLRKRIAGMDEGRGVEQFLREARAAAQIEHPNVVRIYEINQHAGWWYIAMEMVDGDSIQQVVKAAGPLPPARACPLIADAASALAVAHGLGMIHRDVKPNNLMITRNGRCKLTDFGLVRLNDPNDPFDFTNRSVGSPRYIAPEVIRRENITPAADVYGLGATLYFALTGRPPYDGQTVTDILKQHVTAPIPDVRKSAPECPASLALLLQRALAKDPAARPTAASLAASLNAETIAWRSESSAASLGSTVLTHDSGLLPGGSGTLATGTVSRLGRLWNSRRLRAGGVLLFIMAVAAAVWYAARVPTARTQDRGPLATLAGRFPDAPETYGVLSPGETLAPAPQPSEAPAFSWVGKVDTVGIRYVASQRGRRFYHIDDPVARFIRQEDFVGYRTADEATAAGKVAPP